MLEGPSFSPAGSCVGFPLADDSVAPPAVLRLCWVPAGRYRNNFPAEFLPAVELGTVPSNSIRAMVVADFDGDGDYDVVTVPPTLESLSV